MNLEKTLSTAQKNGAAAVIPLYHELLEQRFTVEQEAKAAIEAYFMDAGRKKAALAEKVHGLKQQQDDLEAKIGSYAPRLTRAAVEDGPETVEKIQSEMADIEARKTAVSKQISILSEAHVTGSKETFSAAETKVREMEAESEKINTQINQILDFADAQIALWREILPVDTGAGIYTIKTAADRIHENAEKMREHFGGTEVKVTW